MRADEVAPRFDRSVVGVAVLRTRIEPFPFSLILRLEPASTANRVRERRKDRRGYQHCKGVVFWGLRNLRNYRRRNLRISGGRKKNFRPYDRRSCSLRWRTAALCNRARPARACERYCDADRSSGVRAGSGGPLRAKLVSLRGRRISWSLEGPPVGLSATERCRRSRVLVGEEGVNRRARRARRSPTARARAGSSTTPSRRSRSTT